MVGGLVFSLIVGAVVGAFGALTLVAKTAAGRRLVIPRLPTHEPKKPIIHMRGHTPSWFGSNYCEAWGCWQSEVPDRPGHYYRSNACYVDQDGHYWCERHLPKDTKIAERASKDATEDGRCVIHDCECPKPWAPY